jgi:hypothetical protein
MACSLALLALLGLHASLSWAQTDDELRAIYHRRDISRMEEIARTGDVRAEAWMGLMLQHKGRRLEAKEWWRRAAEKGNLWAIRSLASMHRRDKEYEEAARWLARGADGGHVDSMVEFAFLLLKGQGVSKDERAAAQWYSTAAARGHKYSYVALAELYASGTGVPRDAVEAYVLVGMAEANFDHSDSAMYGAHLAELKTKIEKDLSPTQLAAATVRVDALRPDLRARGLGKQILLILMALGLGTLLAIVVYRGARRLSR